MPKTKTSKTTKSTKRSTSKPQTKPVSTGVCACGCGTATGPRASYCPGHDHRHVSQIIRDHYGDLASFVAAHTKIRRTRTPKVA